MTHVKIRNPISSPLILLVVLFFGVTTSFGQNETCSPKATFVLADSDTLIYGVKVTATNIETKKSYNPIKKDGALIFVNIPEGKYRFISSKPGYKRTITEKEVSCICADKGFANVSLPLVRGNSKETVKVKAPDEVVTFGKPDNEGPATSAGNAVGDVVNSKVVNLAKPTYPPAAIAVRATGAVKVQVTIDEEGKVISAKAIEGHPLLRASAEKAASESVFAPTTLCGRPVKVTGVLVYNFTS